MASRETENNAYAKFWRDKQRALWYVMVFLEWSIDSRQNRVSADHYHLTVSRLRYRPIDVQYFLKFSDDRLLVFK